MLFGLIKFFFRLFFKTIKSLFYLFVPEETRTQLKEGAKAKAGAAGKAGFSFVGRIIVPLVAFCFISFASFIYAIIPGAFDGTSNANERSPYDMSDNYNRPKVRRGVTQNSEDLRKNPIIIEDNDKAFLQGTWEAHTQITKDGTNTAPPGAATFQYIFNGDTLTIKGYRSPDRVVVVNYKIDSTKLPKEMDMWTTQPSEKVLAIYELNGNELRICNSALKDRPNNFEIESGEIPMIWVFKKIQ